MSTPQCNYLAITVPSASPLHAPSLSENERKNQRLRFNSLLKQLWSLLMRAMSGSYEPKVWHKVDRQGHITSWQMFDPESGSTISFGSELEVRLWLEQRYYQ